MISETVDLEGHAIAPTRVTSPELPASRVATGIGPLDERIGGLEPGGSYLVVGTPGPAKLVAALHFLSAGLSKGEPGLLLTNADEEGILAVARAWGFELERPWKEGLLELIAFRPDFELRAVRSLEPEEVLEELDLLAGRHLARVAVDPSSLFLAGGAKSLLGAAFLKWARTHPATVCSTFSVDGAATSLPSSADWLIHATTGRLSVEWEAEDLYRLALLRAVPKQGDREQPVSVELRPGAGLVVPDPRPARRGRDRPLVDPRRLLLISVGEKQVDEVERWARGAFTADVVSEPFEAIARVQADPSFGAVLIHTSRTRVREAVQACRALRPLTRAAIVFASDDAVRSTDRIDILESGADDCLSGGIDFRELDLRIRQAIAGGVKPVLARSRQDAGRASATALDENLRGGRVSRDFFRRELARRADSQIEKFFCVLDVTSTAIPLTKLEELLALQVRADQGDLVSADSIRCVVLLQGAREGQLEPFMNRLRSRIEEVGGGSGGTVITVLSHPADAERIAKILARPNERAG